MRWVRGAETRGRLVEKLASLDSLAPDRRLRRCRYVRRQLQPRGGQDIADEAFQLGEVAGNLAEGGRGLLRVAFSGEVERDADPGERRAQLVRHVGEQLPLGPHQVPDALGHLVEGDGDVAQLVVAPQIRASGELAGAQVARGLR